MASEKWRAKYISLCLNVSAAFQKARGASRQEALMGNF